MDKKHLVHFYPNEIRRASSEPVAATNGNAYTAATVRFIMRQEAKF
jgi:hypothetical protein